jgi:competence protein ComEA
MNKVIRTFFFFSKRERIGVAVLLTILFGFILAPRVYSFFQTEEIADFSTFDQAITLLDKNNAGTKSYKNSNRNNNQNTNVPIENISLFPFDPNNISKDSMLLLGIPQKTANIIANYRNKGGQFYKPERFKKMYTLSPELYQKLKPYITIKANGKSKPQFVKKFDKKESTPKTIKLYLFDPNQATLEELQQLGLSKKTSTTLIKFRSKGGKFYKKEDLKKVYGLSENQYQQLETYINIPQKQFAENNIPTSYNKPSDRIANSSEVNLKKPIKIDINKATPEDWQSLYGIGPAYAKRITNFRAKLGGFSNIKQVAETYGIPDSTFQKIKASLLPSPILQKIQLNSCDAKALSDHPYIKYQLANTIIAYRKQHGPYEKVEDLMEIGNLSEEVFKRIKPYLTVE